MADLEPFPGVGLLDYEDKLIAVKRDLEDFSMLCLKVKGVPREDLVSGKIYCYLKFVGDIGSYDFNLFKFPDGSPAYLTDEGVAEPLINDGSLNIPNSGYYGEFKIPPEMFDNENTEATFLFEGKKPGKGAWMVKVFKDSELVVEKPLVHVEMYDIKDMYEHYTVGDFTSYEDYSPNDIPMTYSRVGDFEYKGYSPEQKDYILFVHGWRMQTWERRAFAETSYPGFARGYAEASKRLFWQGYKGRFGIFTWPTEWVDVNDWFSAAKDIRNYDRSEHKAWWSANGLRELLADLNTKYPGRVRMFAHSMGNIVASEALRLEASSISPSRFVHTYVASQAATVAHAYDSSAPTIFEEPDAITHEVYGNYPPFASEERHEYFKDIAGAISNSIVNFHNREDYALTSLFGWETNQHAKPDLDYGYESLTDTYLRIFPPDTLIFPENRCEIFSHISEARSRALGAQPGTKNVINSEVDLNAAPYEYKDKDYQHSAQFNSNIIKRWDYWKRLLSAFKISIPR